MSEKCNYGDNPRKNSPLPWRVFDPGKKDPLREVYIVDADGYQVTSTGSLFDPVPLSLENAKKIVEAVNAQPKYAKILGELQSIIDSYKARMAELEEQLTCMAIKYTP